MILIAKPLLIAAATLLATSMVANALLGWAYLGARDDLAEANGARDQARGAAKSCSTGVRELQRQAAETAREGARLRAKADSEALAFEKRAQRILAAPAAFPGDDCRSADAAIDEWLHGRVKP